MAKAVPVPGLEAMASTVHEAVTGGPAVVHVSFYPYVSTKSTIRQRDDGLHVRLSDHLENAPDDALRGIIGILIARLRRLPEARVDGADRAAYHAYIDDEDTTQRRAASRRSRGRKHIDPIGEHRSLLESFLRVSLEMDLDLPEAPTLSWSRTRSRRRLGHQDSDHGAIVISRILDDPNVPAFVLDYVVYHELLHIIIPPRRGQGGRRIIHPKEFKQAEVRFPRRDEAEAWLTKLSRGR